MPAALSFRQQGRSVPAFRYDRLRPMASTRCFALNKPFGVLCQFSATDGRQTLADWVDIPGIYPAGRLDADSEGLLLLTDDGKLQAHIAQPGSRRGGKLWKRYWVQVEGIADESAVQKLRVGVELKDGLSKPARARIMHAPSQLWPVSYTHLTLPTIYSV